MKNKFAIGLLAVGAITGISIGVGQAIIEAHEAPHRAAVLAQYQQQLAQTNLDSAAEPTMDPAQAAYCKGEGFTGSVCDAQWESWNAAGEALGRVQNPARERESYGEWKAHQAQAKLNREYCAETPADWSCR